MDLLQLKFEREFKLGLRTFNTDHTRHEEEQHNSNIIGGYFGGEDYMSPEEEEGFVRSILLMSPDYYFTKDGKYYRYNGEYREVPKSEYDEVVAIFEKIYGNKNEQSNKNQKTSFWRKLFGN